MVRCINIRGTSGVGKTTFGREIAQRLGVPFIELDALHHGPNWSAPGSEEFRARVRAAMDAAPDGWVIDGDYDPKLGDTVLAAADTIVWLDFPLWITFPRLWRRTLRRIRTREELWSGNRETWRDQFASKESIFFWSVHFHVQHRRAWPARFGSDPRLVRIRSDKELRQWLFAQSTDSTS